jgi:hypothetical protein
MIKQDVKAMNEGTGIYSNPGIRKVQDWLNSKYGSKSLGEKELTEVVDQMVSDLGLTRAQEGRTRIEGNKLYEQTPGLVNRGALGRDLSLDFTPRPGTRMIRNELSVSKDQVEEALKEVFGIK